jgi:hypothetical protein
VENLHKYNKIMMVPAVQTCKEITKETNENESKRGLLACCLKPSLDLQHRPQSMYRAVGMLEGH